VPRGYRLRGARTGFERSRAHRVAVAASGVTLQQIGRHGLFHRKTCRPTKTVRSASAPFALERPSRGAYLRDGLSEFEMAACPSRMPEIGTSGLMGGMGDGALAIGPSLDCQQSTRPRHCFLKHLGSHSLYVAAPKMGPAEVPAGSTGGEGAVGGPGLMRPPSFSVSQNIQVRRVALRRLCAACTASRVPNLL
jgi:hypothetical protein